MNYRTLNRYCKKSWTCD